MKTILALALVLTGQRNLFQYVEDPPRLPKKKPAAAVVAPVVVAQEPVVVVEDVRRHEPPTFDFPFRYIGSFGPEGNLIAVFVGDEVVTARIGDSFADAFVVREIAAGGVVISRGDILKSVGLAQ